MELILSCKFRLNFFDNKLEKEIRKNFVIFKFDVEILFLGFKVFKYRIKYENYD